MRKISDRQRKRLAEYAKVKKEYLTTRKSFCEVCADPVITDGVSKMILIKADTIHHRRGRAGNLLLDTRFFLSVCNNCHDRIHNNPAWAREHGYLQSWHNTKDIDAK